MDFCNKDLLLQQKNLGRIYCHNKIGISHGRCCKIEGGTGAT